MKANFLFSFLLVTSLFSAEKPSSEDPTPDQLNEMMVPPDGYTINYTTVSIIEYIRFASKICKTNFIYDEADLNFTVTVVSDEPITPQNVMATLIQVLRIHGLMLLEQGNSLLIHKSPDVKQLATLVTEQGEGARSPIVTRIFRIKNAKADSLAAIIRPMISTSALLEVSSETRQLILTDVTPNVDKVAALIENLDSPHTLLEIRAFEAQHNKPEFLIELGGQIMTPLAQGNPFILVPQSLANTIFIVSTPELADKAVSVFTSLDLPPKKEIAAERKLKSENIYVYKAINRTGDELLKALRNLGANLQQSGVPDPDLIEALETAKWILETNSVMFIGDKNSIDKIKEFLLALDVPSGTPLEKTSFFVYKPQGRTAADIQKSILELAQNLKGTKGGDESLLETIESVKINSTTNTVVFSGEERNFSRIRELLATIDATSGRPKGSMKYNFYLYKLQQSNESDLETALTDFAKNIAKTSAADDGLIEAIQSMKYIKETNSLLFTGPDTALQRLQELVPGFDTGVGSKMAASSQFFIYKPTHQRGDQLGASVKDLTDQLKAEKLADPALLRTLQSMKWVKSTNSLIFTGNVESLKKVESLMGTLDVPAGPKAGGEKNFFLYQPQYASKEKTETYLRQVADNLAKRNEEDLVDTIRSMKWIEPSHSFMFQGSENSLNRVKELLTNFDNARQASPNQNGFFLYQPEFASQEKTEQYLNQLADNLTAKGGSEEVIAALRSHQWVPESRSFMFSGSATGLAQVKDLLKNFDTQATKSAGRPGYFIYKVQNTTGDLIEEDLDALEKDFKSSGVQDSGLSDVINKIRYVKETNSLLLTGDPQKIEEVKKLIAEYDYPHKGAAHSPTNFYMYKPQHVPALQIQKSLQDVGMNLKKAGLADQNLLASIETAKYVETTNSLIFTGPPESLKKVQDLIKDIDIPPQAHAPIQHVGKNTFLLFKLKNAGGSQIISQIKAMIADLKKSGTSDKEFLSALNSMKYIKETNSLFFTGDEAALQKVQTLVEQFDVTGFAAQSSKVEVPASGPGNFIAYKPQSLSGPDVEKLIADFAENLKMSGLSDPELFNAINSMRWVDTTQTLVFTGTPKALGQIQELLKTFDIPANLPGGPIATGEPTIQAIDNTSFLVYKLQFHKGDEIQGALRQIAKDLILSNAPVNQNLLNSINSIQWLEVTNSLLSSGDQETLTRLRELIKNLDIPLKQVFIEMLVLQTNMTNALTFGLEWGANYKYRDKFASTTSNTAPSAGSYTPDNFMKGLGGLDASKTPSLATLNNGDTNARIPTSGNGQFDLGIIGEVIRHKGQTFLTLGSLLNALQSDTESSIVMTPKLITQDGRTSTIFVGENIPFVGSFVSTNSAAVVNSSNIEYRDIGFNLTITPVLGNSDMVTLDINLDRTQTTTDVTQASLNPSQSTANGIITSKTTMQTTVHVPDNNFLILSGMVNNSNVKVKTGIPCLGGLPLIGSAFSSSGDTKSNSNIVIFIRPHIINSADDMRGLARDQEEYFRDQAPTPFLQHHFDEGMELIKTIHDE